MYLPFPVSENVLCLSQGAVGRLDQGYHMSFFPGLVLIFGLNIFPGGVFQLVEKFNFFDYLLFLKASAYLMVLRTQEYTQLFLIKTKFSISYRYLCQYMSSTADRGMYWATSAWNFLNSVKNNQNPPATEFDTFKF